MNVLGESVFFILLKDVLSSDVCVPECYACKQLEIAYLREFARGLFRCCANLADRDYMGGVAGSAGSEFLFLRLLFTTSATAGIIFTFLEDVYRLRRTMHIAAVSNVRRAERAFGQLPDEQAHSVYLNHMFVLERRCILMYDHDLDADSSPSPTFVPYHVLMAPLP